MMINAAAKDFSFQLLAALGVNGVVLVDDQHLPLPNMEDVLAVQAAIPPEEFLKIFPEIGEAAADPDIRHVKLEKLWPVLRPEEKQKRIEVLKESIGGDVFEQGVEISEELLSQFFSDTGFRLVQPAEWEREREQIIAEYPNALFLFDQDLSASGGSEEGGMMYLSALVAAEGASAAVCGLFTSKADENNYEAKWQEYADKHGVDKDRFFVIPKQWFNMEEKQIMFTKGLKYVVLAPKFTSLKDKVKDILADAARLATEKVNALSLVDLEHMVIRAPNTEGIWEPDVLFRLYSLYIKLNARRLARANDGLVGLANALRKVSFIPPVADNNYSSDVLQIQQDDLYELGEHINSLHFSIEMGDIFKVNSKEYVLLAQPCDLMIRSNGKRKDSLDYIPVVPIEKLMSKPQYSEEVPFYPSREDCYGNYARFSLVKYVRLDVLDLCAFNSTGKALVCFSDDCVAAIQPSLVNRYQYLKTHYDNVVEQCNAIDRIDGYESGKKKKLKADLLGGGFIRGKLTQNGRRSTIEFPCERIYRLSSERAYALLLALNAYLGRHPFERNFV